MIRLTLAEVAAITGGHLDGGADDAAVVTGPVVADSRQAATGCLFAALRGEHVDGHDHAAAAVRAGAVAALAAHPVPAPAVVVPDVRAALGRLARGVLDRLAARPAPGGPRVVAVTGSSGKTGTKDLIAPLLARAGRCVASPESFNNELGVPLTVLRAGPDTRFLLLEMGARMPGNIRYLCGIAPPSIGVVLNVGAAHTGVFGSREVTAATKAELVEALPAGGVAVLNADDALVAAMTARTAARVVWFGRSAAAQVRAEQVRLDSAARASFRLVTPAGAASLSLRLHGVHHVGNALAAAAVGLEAGLDVGEVAQALSARQPASKWRMEVHERPDGVVVVNDAYNANPDSVRAGLQALVAMGAGRRTWAVLGEMLELGEAGPAEHDAAGRLAAGLGVGTVVAVGEGARPVHEGARSAGARTTWVPGVPQALELLADGLRPGDVVLVKASRSIGLDRLASGLLHDAAAGQDRPDRSAGHNEARDSGRTGEPGAADGGREGQR